MESERAANHFKGMDPAIFWELYLTLGQNILWVLMVGKTNAYAE
jgi:hypothetical protein